MLDPRDNAQRLLSLQDFSGYKGRRVALLNIDIWHTGTHMQALWLLIMGEKQTGQTKMEALWYYKHLDQEAALMDPISIEVN